MRVPMTLAVLLGTTRAAKLNGFLSKEDLPQTGEQWMTLKNGVEFLPNSNLSPLAQYHLRKLTSDNSFEEETPFAEIFVDGSETYYDEYAQAWRALGWYIDCDSCNQDSENGGTTCWWQERNNDDENNNNNNNGNNNNNNNNNDADRNNDYAYRGGCRRYLLWAAVSNCSFFWSL